MMTATFRLLPYARRYRRDVLRLANDGGGLLHTHLDWQLLDEWLDSDNSPMFLAYAESRLVGIMAGAPPIQDTSWLRLVALDEQADAETVIPALWERLGAHLIERGVQRVGILAMQPWLTRYLPHMGFSPSERVITLRRDGLDCPVPLRADLNLRHTDLRDHEAALMIDRGAFTPMWQISNTALRFAIRHAASFSLAELNGQPVGYQITTVHMRVGHLARLAVLPSWQGTGIGGALLADVIEKSSRRGILSMTVNTQSSNVQSLGLYRRYHFAPTGQEIACWECWL